MTERITIRQNKDLETEFWSQDPESEEPGETQPISQIHALTPYGMLLASLGSCTAIIVNTYAGKKNLNLETVELRLSYNRSFTKDCENCDDLGEMSETIAMEIEFSGDLTSEERQKLFLVSKQCPIHKKLHEGIEINTQLVENQVSI